MRCLVALIALVACGDNRHPTKRDDAALPAACVPARGMKVTAKQVATVPGVPMSIPVRAAWPPGESQRMFVVMREGQIRIVDNGALLPDPFIDLSASIYAADTVERGLLDMVFHPAYATNGQFFVYYTTATDCVVARCTVSAADKNRASPTCTPVLQILHDRAGNHNGSSMAFGSDGFLYVGTGDGGGAGDPNRRAQDRNDLLGKILRIDVDHPANGLAYGIPADNPYANGGGRPEVFIRGLRNPWRFAFDRSSGDLWIGDVGQSHAEELDVLRPAEQNNANLGWSLYEADGCCATQDDHCFQVMSLPCDPTGLVFPKDVRDRFTPAGDGWASIIGGETYRGSCYPDLAGWHFYIDYYASVLVRARLLADGTLEKVDLPDVPVTAISSIDEDPRGEIYLVSTNGPIYALSATP